VGVKACASFFFYEQPPILYWQQHQLLDGRQAQLHPVLEEEHNQQANWPLIDQQQGCLLGVPTDEKQNPCQ
jgi:hypothetical protein